MITMHPIHEPAVLESLHAARFGEATRGYVVMDGPDYLGHLLFTVNGAVTTVQECSLPDTALVDGGVRACVAAGENAGATHYALNETDAALAKWQGVFCKGKQAPFANSDLFHQCQGEA